MDGWTKSQWDLLTKELSIFLIKAEVNISLGLSRSWSDQQLKKKKKFFYENIIFVHYHCCLSSDAGVSLKLTVMQWRQLSRGGEGLFHVNNCVRVCPAKWRWSKFEANKLDNLILFIMRFFFFFFTWSLKRTSFFFSFL